MLIAEPGIGVRLGETELRSEPRDIRIDYGEKSRLGASTHACKIRGKVSSARVGRRSRCRLDFACSFAGEAARRLVRLPCNRARHMDCAFSVRNVWGVDLGRRSHSCGTAAIALGSGKRGRVHLGVLAKARTA